MAASSMAARVGHELNVGSDVVSYQVRSVSANENLEHSVLRCTPMIYDRAAFTTICIVGMKVM